MQLHAYLAAACSSLCYTSVHEAPTSSRTTDALNGLLDRLRSWLLLCPSSRCSNLLFCLCNKHHDQKPLMEERAYLSLHLNATVGHWGNSKQELKAVTMEKCCLLEHPKACPRIMLSQFPYKEQVHLPRKGVALSGWTVPLQSTIGTIPHRHRHKTAWSAQSPN